MTELDVWWCKQIAAHFLGKKREVEMVLEFAGPQPAIVHLHGLSLSLIYLCILHLYPALALVSNELGGKVKTCGIKAKTSLLTLKTGLSSAP